MLKLDFIADFAPTTNTSTQLQQELPVCIEGHFTVPYEQ
jgi:hypothetical protein